MEMADVYGLCSRERPWSKCSTWVEGRVLACSNVTVIVWPQIALQYPVCHQHLQSGEKRQHHTFMQWQATSLCRILFGLFSQFKQYEDVEETEISLKVKNPPSFDHFQSTTISWGHSAGTAETTCSLFSGMQPPQSQCKGSTGKGDLRGNHLLSWWDTWSSTSGCLPAQVALCGCPNTCSPAFYCSWADSTSSLLPALSATKTNYHTGTWLHTDPRPSEHIL